MASLFPYNFFMIIGLAKIFAALRNLARSAAANHARGRNGQAMTEYAIVAGVLTLSALILAVFLYTFREHSGRTLDLVTSDYP